MKIDDTYYTYEIKKVVENENSSHVLDIYYGSEIKRPLRILKNDILSFIKAVIPKEQLCGITDNMLMSEINENGLEIINQLLKGRIMVFISEYRDYNEYNMPVDYYIKKITCLNIDGKIEKENAFSYANYSLYNNDIINNYCLRKVIK